MSIVLSNTQIVPYHLSTSVSASGQRDVKQLNVALATAHKTTTEQTGEDGGSSGVATISLWGYKFN